ncbi:hypothetical protein ACTXT7_013564 [Hymenolepis weldensis]
MQFPSKEKTEKVNSKVDCISAFQPYAGYKRGLPQLRLPIHNLQLNLIIPLKTNREEKKTEYSLRVPLKSFQQ